MRTTFAVIMSASFTGCSADLPSVSPSDRSWSTGTITVTPTCFGAERGVDVKARWPDCGDGLWIRYELRLAQTGAPDVFLIGSSSRLTTFQQGGTGVGDYTQAPAFLRQIDWKKPYRAVFDYEIRRGEPMKGELLAKNSVFSPEIGPVPPE